MKLPIRTAIAALCVLCVSLAPALAQDVTVSGQVVDAQRAAVINAQVRLTSAGRPDRLVSSGPDGAFAFQAIAPGAYVIRVEAPGFAPATTEITVSGTAPPVTIRLELQGVREDVSVQAALLGTAATGKTAVPLRELPLTVHSVPGALIAEQGVNDLVTALQNVPGVNAFTTYGVYEYYAFRGFLDSVQLVDGVRNEGNRVNTQLANIDRIEVLKGPSSALYGGAALGATVNLIRKRPAAAPAYDFTASAGSWKTARSAFGATGRLGTDAALYRLDAGAESKDGYRHNDARRLTVTPSLSWHLGGAGQVHAYYTFDRDWFAGDAGLPLIDSSFDIPVSDNVPDIPRDRNFRTPQDHAVSYDHNLQVSYARQLTGTLGFRDTLSYRHFNDEYFLSEGLTFEPPSTVLRDYLYFKHHRRPLMNIAELTGSMTRGLEQNLVVGWESQRYDNFTTLPEEDFFSAEPIDLFNPIETQGPSDLTIAHINYFTNTTNAVYVQDHVAVSPQLKILLGGRYDIYRRRSHSDDVSGGVQTAGPIARRKAEAFTARAGLVYQPSSRVDLYASFANAFKPSTLAQPDGSSLDPETGSQIEVGQRFRLADDRVQLNTSVYRILKQHVAFSRPGNVYVQAGEVESRGFEAELETSLRSRVRINVGYGFTDASFLDYEESPGVNLRGNVPTFAPRHTLNVWTGYDWANGLGVNLGARYFGRTFADNSNVFEVDGYGLLNLGLRYRRGRLEYQLNVNNVTDSKYYTAHQDYAQVYPGDPVNALGTVRIHWR